MKIVDIQKEARTIWGDAPMSLEHIVIALGVVYGDLCRQARSKLEDGTIDDIELQKELGNLLFSVIRWCEDFGYDPQQCIELARQAQRRYNQNNNA